MFSPRALTSASVLFCLVIVSSSGATLPTEEVNALRQIARTIGKTNWDFSVDPCGGERGWNAPTAAKGFENGVICNCTYADNTVCHIVRILLKNQNLSGIVPAELVRLPYLQDIDLTRNYLNGTIPREWGSMQLINISLFGNRVSGPIPKELAKISTLVNLSLAYNQLSGNIPSELADLPRIEKLYLTSNKLTGELPGTLAKLSTLKDFRIGDNQFSGSIPNFIQNWTNIQKLMIQGSGLSGPIPSGIASLTKLTDLRISDLNGNASSFPPLANANNLETLILRSCNIIGQLDDYLARMAQLKVLDLSFNKLTGQISSSLSALSTTEKIYFTGNQLTGPVPDWIWQHRGDNIDLSYNNLTVKDFDCQSSANLNLFSSTSKDNTSGMEFCLRSVTCPWSWHSLHINCGGGEVIEFDGSRVYEGDSQEGGASMFFRGGRNWAFSSTGHFLEDERFSKSYIAKSTSSISGDNSQLYMTARLSPLSLTYYGFCLQNGNYTVNLHFAEIMFTADRTYSSLGRRIFDVYVQGKPVLKDFNIEEEAGGVKKAKIKSFTGVVTDTTLEIRFYWAGKGTSGIPFRGVYGPLISAISVDPDFPVPSAGGNCISTGAVSGIVIGVVFTILFLGILWWKREVQRRNLMYRGLKGLDLRTGSFTLRQIKAATNNFDPANKIGEGGFGSVYKGLLFDGTTIAVKQLSSKSKQGNREFINEIGMISALQHPNLVKLYGCCAEGNQLLLVYEYMENNSLARALFGPEECQSNLDWATRHKICIGIARGLAYLHEESRLKIVHRDIKATNVLLDKDLDPKISDFGLAKLDEEENTHISTRIAGTLGYMAPEYAMRGRLTDKADVYSFGIVALEIVSGRSNTSVNPKEDSLYLLDWALVLNEKGNLMELVDSRLGSNFDKDQVLTTINVALLCANVSPAVRPRMSTVVSMLEGRPNIQAFASDLSISNTNTNPKEKKTDHQYNLVTKALDSQLLDIPRAESSTASSDLYPVNVDTEYWDNRL